MLQFSKFVWAQSYAVSDVFNNFLLIDKQIEVGLVAIKSAFYRIKPILPFIFREHSLLNLFKYV